MRTALGLALLPLLAGQLALAQTASPQPARAIGVKTSARAANVDFNVIFDLRFICAPFCNDFGEKLLAS